MNGAVISSSIIGDKDPMWDEAYGNDVSTCLAFSYSQLFKRLIILCPLLIPTHHRITLYKAEEEVVVEAGGDRVGEIESPESLVGTGGIKASDF